MNQQIQLDFKNAIQNLEASETKKDATLEFKILIALYWFEYYVISN